MGRWAMFASLSLGIAAPLHAEPGVHVKQAIADSMTPEELAAYTARLAAELAARRAVAPLPADVCDGATAEVSALPFGPVSDTTIGQTDDIDLPSDVTAPTCTAATSCTGAGPMGSLPRGASYTGTGTGPDRVYKIRTDAPCDLTITLDPTGAEDMSLIVFEAACSNNLADCACVDDTGTGGVAETVTLSAQAGIDYFIVVDGYSTGATPPGPSGPFDLTITGTGCNLVGEGTTTTTSTIEPETTTTSTTTTSTTTIPTSSSSTVPPAGGTTTTTLVPFGPTGCTGGASISKAKLRITQLADPSGDEGLDVSGVLDFAPGVPDPFNPPALGAQLLVEDLGAATVLFDLTSATAPIPPGGRGTGCAAKDGWKGTRYKNQSGALLPPACPPGSARGLRTLQLADKRAKGKGVKFTAMVRDATIPQPQGPIRVTVVTSAGSSAAGAGQCATHTFEAAGCKLGRKGLSCK